MSKRKLASLAGFDASYITHIEAGRKKPSLDAIEKLAGVLGVPVPLLMMLSAEADDLKGISPDQATALGGRLMNLMPEVTE